MRILVVTGGKGSERDISLLSAGELQKALKELKHFVEVFDHQEGYINLGAKVKDFDLVFPMLHGGEGEDGKLYEFLHYKNVPFIGSNFKGAKIAFDKILFKKYCVKNNLPTLKWREVKTSKDILMFGTPCVLKAARGGSSIEVEIIRSGKDLKKSSVGKLLKIKDRLFVEKYMVGVEITVGILGDKPLPPVEIIPPNGEWFDYENKYSGETKEIVGAPSVGKSVVKKAQKYALKIHKDLNLGPYSRTDFIVVNDIPWILEVNTPGGVGFTSESLFPKAAKAIGFEFKDLVNHLIVNHTKSRAK